MGQSIKITENNLQKMISEAVVNFFNGPNNPYRDYNIYQDNELSENDIQEWNETHEQLFNVWKGAWSLSAALTECDTLRTPSVRIGPNHPVKKNWRLFRNIDNDLIRIVETCEEFFKIYQLVVNKKRMSDEEITEYYCNLWRSSR